MRRALLLASLVAAGFAATAVPGATARPYITANQSSLDCTARPTNPDQTLAESVGATTYAPPDITPAVAILDTGVDQSVPELGGKVVSAFNVLTGTKDAPDTDGHGTEVAGVAVARPGYMRGISPSSPIVAIKMLDNEGEGSADGVAKAIDAAVARGAKVINISGAGPAAGVTAAQDEVVEKAINRAYSAGAVVVAAMGNEGKSELSVPAAYPHVVSVGAVDQSNSVRARFSNYGPDLDIVAPGQQIFDVAPPLACPAGYAYATGTSFAAPAVSGALAVLTQLRPALTPGQRVAQLLNAARDLGDKGWDSQTGWGILDLGNALRASTPPPDGPEVDDDIYWVTGARARTHPPVLTTKKRSTTVNASVAAFNDPIDVIPVRLRKGDRFSARLAGSVKKGFTFGLYNPSASSFELDSTKQPHLVRSGTSRLSVRRINRSGIWFVAVAAPNTPTTEVRYSLSVSAKRP
jgi:serine protease